MRRQRHEGVARFNLFVPVNAFLPGAAGIAIKAIPEGGSPGKVEPQDATRRQDWHAKLALGARPVKLFHMRIVGAGILLQLSIPKPEIVDLANEGFAGLGIKDAAGGPDAAL